MSGIAATGLRRRHSHSLGSEQTQTSPERPAERLLASIVSPDRGSHFLSTSIGGAVFNVLSSIDLSQQLRGSGSSNQIFLLQNNTTYLIEEDTFIGQSFFQLSASNVLNTMQFNILDFNHTTGNATSVLGQLEEDDWSGCVCLCGIVVLSVHTSARSVTNSRLVYCLPSLTGLLKMPVILNGHPPPKKGIEPPLRS